MTIYKTLVNRAIGLMSGVFANGPGDRGSIPGRVIPKTKKMVLGAALLNTLIGVVAIEKGAFRSHSTNVANFTLYNSGGVKKNPNDTICE